jgi:hypothetical protein
MKLTIGETYKIHDDHHVKILSFDKGNQAYSVEHTYFHGKFSKTVTDEVNAFALEELVHTKTRDKIEKSIEVL